jgi:hypothetical protein
MKILTIAILFLLFSCESTPTANYYITDNYGYKYYTDSIRDNGNGCILFKSKQGYTEGMIIKLCGYNSIIEHGKRTNTR